MTRCIDMSKSPNVGRVEPVTFKSELLDRRCNVFVYRPPGWRRGAGPILYLLHGKDGSETDWLYKGRIAETADRLTASGRIGRMVIVMPNDGLLGDGTFYSNWYDGTGRFEDYIIKEVVRQVERTLGGRANRSRRAIAGLSMGGYGAVTLALRHPGMFRAAASLSGAFEPLGRQWYRRVGRRAYGPADGAYRLSHSPNWLVRHSRAGKRVALHVNCGRSDLLIEQNRRLHRDLVGAGVEHEYVEFPGGHDWGYWTKRIVPVLDFVWRQLR